MEKKYQAVLMKRQTRSFCINENIKDPRIINVKSQEVGRAAGLLGAGFS